MKVKELIAHLKQFDGNLEVYGFCDHGQTPEKVSSPQEIYVEEATHSVREGFATDEVEAEEYGYTVKAVLL